ncbi:MAG: efflux RND transporter periplasmic adaptor subunit [Salibacteraceae bacterium]
MQKFLKKGRPVFLLLLISFGWTACGEEEKSTEKFIRPVKYQVVGFNAAAKDRTYSGVAEIDKSISLSFRSSGVITQFNIKLGQKVKKGQLLARLDNVQAKLSYENSISSKNSAESQMKTAKSTLDRVRSLYEKGSTSLSDYESAKNAYETANQSFNNAKRSVEIQKEQLNYGILYAPENGTIATVNAEIDENIIPGQQIATLNAGQQMEISLGLPESVINQVKTEALVNVGFPALGDQQFEGKVTEVAPAIDGNTSTYPVRITVTNPIDEIKSGMAANVTFDFSDEGPKNTALTVASNAVGEDSKGRFVFLIEEKEGQYFVRKQPVTLGQLTSAGFEIVSGIEEGQKIATAGLQTLLDGQEVKL